MTLTSNLGLGRVSSGRSRPESASDFNSKSRLNPSSDEHADEDSEGDLNKDLRGRPDQATNMS